MSDSSGGRPRDLGIEGYRDFVRIGSGGYSTVYRAHQELFDRDVAVKILSVHVVDDSARRRFHRECSAAGRISAHPNVATLLDAGFTATGSPYITSELCPGGSLADRVRAEGPLPADEVVALGVKLADGLQAVHDAGVLHRDIKPANILVSSYGEPMLADFGIALADTGVHATGANLATPYYTAPETLRGRDPSIAADVYSLSATLWELLTGTPPHAVAEVEPIAAMLDRIEVEALPPIVRPDVPRGLEPVLRAGLAIDPAARPRTARALADALRSLAEPDAAGASPEAALGATPDGGGGRATARIPRPLLMGLGVVIGLVVAAGLVVLVRSDDDDTAEPGTPQLPQPAGEVASLLDLLGDFRLGGDEIHAELTEVSDQSGVLTLEIPVEWDEVDTAGQSVAGAPAPGIAAADDLDQFQEMGESSGTEVLVVPGVDPTDPDALGDVLASLGLPDDCVTTGSVAFDDGRFTGTAEALEGCGGGDGVYVALLAGPPGGEPAVFIGSLLQSDADAALADRFFGDVQSALDQG